MQDKLCYHLAGYTASYINDKFTKAYPSTNIKIIKSVRSFNAYGLPIDALPLLKIYRIQESYKPRSPHYSAELNAEYFVPYPYVERLNGILPFVSETFVEALYSYNRSHKVMIPDAPASVVVSYVFNNQAYQEIVQGFTATIILDKLPYNYLSQ